MSGFRLKLNRLRNIPYASSIQESLSFESSFEVEYFFNGQGFAMIVKPILINSMVIFLVTFPGDDQDALALVYNKKDTWSDIEKESTGVTEAMGAAIENYYSNCYLPWSEGYTYKEGYSDLSWESPLLN